MGEAFGEGSKKLYSRPPRSGNLPEDGFGRTELTHAILRHRTREALDLLERYDEVNHQDNGGISDLYFAAQSCEPEIVKELLRRGADPNLESLTGATPLFAALDAAQAHSHNKTFDAYQRAFEMVRLLLEAGADPDKRSKSGSTPRKLAKYLTPGPIAEYLEGCPGGTGGLSIHEKQGEGPCPGEEKRVP